MTWKDIYCYRQITAMFDPTRKLFFNKNNRNDEIVIPIPFEKAMIVEFQLRCWGWLELDDGLASHAILMPIHAQEPLCPHFSL